LPEARRALRAELGVPADAFVVGGCGSLNWWKAPELFVLAAHRLRVRRPEARVHFVWVGGTVRSAEHERLCHDVDRLGLGGTVHFLGTLPDPHPHFALFDAFLLSSREDSFPFVCVEAAALGLPIVCFERSGGAPELVEDDAGFVVPYLDLDAAADRLAMLMDDPALRHRLGEHAASKTRGRYTLKHMGHELGTVLDRYVTGSHVSG
jgi:glycosyltransferase involved in cell wall biosynthesis